MLPLLQESAETLGEVIGEVADFGQSTDVFK